MHHRRSIRTLRRHLWLSAAFSTLCFAGVVVLAGLLPAPPSIGWGALVDSGGTGPVGPLAFSLHRSVWPGLVLALVASVVTANFLYQRMREPLAHYVRCYESLAEGVVPAQVTIRARDYLADETDALNSMIASLRRQQTVRREAVARLEEAIGDLAAQDVPESILAELQDIAKRLSVAPPSLERGVGVTGERR